MNRVWGLERAVEVALLVFGISYLVVMLRYPRNAGIVPAIVSLVLIGAVGLQLVRGLLASRRQVREAMAEEAEEDEDFRGLIGQSGMDRAARQRLAIIIAWTIAMLVIVQLIGFVVGAAVGMAVFMLIVRQPWPLALAAGVVLGIGVYGLMDVVLDIPWNSAPLLELLTG